MPMLCKSSMDFVWLDAYACFLWYPAYPAFEPRGNCVSRQLCVNVEVKITEKELSRITVQNAVANAMSAIDHRYCFIIPPPYCHWNGS
eukprot:5843945-Amphidinium_carterae.1